ncbi:unnamed protein product, partial [Timema podura]|nr:unnamed protein product [Timema podura]
MEKNDDLKAPEDYDEELEELLDSALKDFDQPISSTPLTHPIEEHKKAFNATKWSEEFFKEATDEFERSMQSLLKVRSIDPEVRPQECPRKAPISH